MAEIPVGYAQFNIRYTGAAVPTGAEWTLGVDISGYAGNPGDACGDMAAALTSSDLMDNFVNTLAITSILCKFGPNSTGPSAEVSVNEPGQNSAAGVSPAVSALVQKRTALGGRAGRGRLFLPGLREQDITEGGVITPAVVLAISNHMEDLAAALALSALEPVVLHSATSPLAVPTPITGFECQSIAATQRRRQRR